MSDELTIFDRIDVKNFLEAAPVEAELQLRRRCMERVNDIRMQTVLADQFKAEAARLRQRAEESGEDEVLREMHLAKAVVLETQAIGSLDRVDQSKRELVFYINLYERG